MISLLPREGHFIGTKLHGMYYGVVVHRQFPHAMSEGDDTKWFLSHVGPFCEFLATMQIVIKDDRAASEIRKAGMSAACSEEQDGWKEDGDLGLLLLIDSSLDPPDIVVVKTDAAK